MSLLDDADALRAGDPQGLIEAYLSAGEQLRRAHEETRDLRVDALGVRSVVLCGMGGSAAAADVVVAAFEDDAPVAMSVRRGYRLPAWVGHETLVICLSYSGDTEETVAAYDAAKAVGARLLTISAGGSLAERASADRTAHAAVAPGAPQPRAALGSLTGALLAGLTSAGILEAEEEQMSTTPGALRALAAELGPGTPTDTNRAKQLAAWIGARVPVVWGSEGVSAAAAWRWKCAFNENAKIPSFASTLPELSHHEVVGWTKGRGDAFCVLVLREPGEHPSVQPRLDATLEEMRGADIDVQEVRVDGPSPLARALSLAMIGDVAGAYHALAAGIDPAPIDAIARVKRRLQEGS
ncbi:MAG: bifunctional phosphoglucose/phosphomannose isomerase [Actinomycetota bacterium]